MRRRQFITLLGDAAAGTTPIVMTVSNYDPVARGYIKNLARPDGQVREASPMAA